MKKTIIAIAAFVLMGIIFSMTLTSCAPKEPADVSAPAASSSNAEEMSIETLTMDVFADYDLTLVNIFATWCGPCVREIPELEQLSQNMADKNVNVIGVCLDTLDSKGNVSPDGVAKAMELAARSGATYTFYAPDLEAFDGRFMRANAVPETFFVDSEGNIVGETYLGARDLANWTKIVEAELEALKA